MTGLKAALRVSPQTFRDKSHRSEEQWTKLPDRVTRGEFEQSIEKRRHVPVAVWNKGFNAAADQLDKIVPWLQGDLNVL